ncbi:hypothetical protein TrST_g10800 [Triparma strigata]|uniref:Fe2OG dioxygenase domain-containing protein n=1 Tax=Triparma strigata TaxID=1606541 RepID=A0A9W7C7L4_9STRA|nr:hypothetical protein TrST_g10800 [Triparma strigata]
MSSFNIPELTTIDHQPPKLSHGAIGDSVPSLNSCIVNRYYSDDSVVSPHHDGQIATTAGAQKPLLSGTSIFSVTVCEIGSERCMALHELEAGTNKPMNPPIYLQELINGSLFELSSSANGRFKHSIPAVNSTKKGVRYAFLFRTVIEVLLVKLEERKAAGDIKAEEKHKSKSKNHGLS